MSRLVDVTPFGARLRLKRPTEPGRLLLLTTAMPRQLRCYDHIENQYRVWSLVRNAKLLDPKKENGALLEIGIAFVGKHPPQSFQADPTRRYEIGKAASGLWTVEEESAAALTEVADIDQRDETRHTIPMEVSIELISGPGSEAQTEATVTENISAHGAAVFTTLKVSPGQFVKMRSTQSGIEILAAMRAAHVGADGVSRLHLAFVGDEWPL